MRAIVALVIVAVSISSSPAAQKIIIEVVSASESSVAGGYQPGTSEKKETPVGITTYSAKIIWPNGSHLFIMCNRGSAGCGPIDSFHPEDSKRTVQGSITTVTGLGKFDAKRGKRDELIIYTATGKRKYRITDSW